MLNNIKKLKNKGFTWSFLSKRAGFTIVEVLVAIFIITIGVIGVIKIIPQIISNTSLNSSNLTAAYLVQEGFEIVRNIRDSNWLEQRTVQATDWDEGLADCLNGCEADYTVLAAQDPVLNSYSGINLKINSDGFYNYALGSDSRFKRKITIIRDGTDILNVSILISWDKGGSFSAQEKLYKWR